MKKESLKNEKISHTKKVSHRLGKNIKKHVI
jgi:hypothetical protein